MSVRNCARYSALALAASRSIARSTTDCGSDRIEVARCALRHQDQLVAVSAEVPLVNVPQRAAPGVRRLDAMMSGPPVVAKPGRTALRISTSALALKSRPYQNAASSAITAM